MKVTISAPRHQTGPLRRRAIYRGLIASVSLALIATCDASLYIGAGELSLRTTLAHEYDSNIFGNNLEIDDHHTIATPELVFVRDQGILRLESQAGAKGHRFEENDSENSWDPFLQGKLNLLREEDKMDGLLDASFRRVNEANPDVNTRTQSDEIRVDANFGHFPTAKLGYRASANYSDSDFESRTFSDLRSHSFELAGRYLYSPRYDIFVSYGIPGKAPPTTPRAHSLRATARIRRRNSDCPVRFCRS